MIRAFAHNPKDGIAGLIFLAIGAGAFALAHDYEIGTATSMGPGYFPAVLGIALMLIGAASLARGLRGQPEPIARVHLLPLVQIVAGVLGFAALIERAGLVAAVFVLVACACLTRIQSRPIEVLVTFLVLAAFAVAVFIRVLHLPITAF